MTRNEVIGWSIPLGVGLASLLLALTMPPSKIEWSGWIYWSLPILLRLRAWQRGRKPKA
jgi:hypothetical protein